MGDFGKYGLLRRLVGLEGSRRIRLGIQWYLTEPENNSDGELRDFLEDRKENQKNMVGATKFYMIF